VGNYAVEVLGGAFNVSVEVDIDTSELSRALDDSEVQKELTGELIRDWHTFSQETLLARGEDYDAYGGKSDMAKVFPVARSATVPSWNGSSWSFGFEHPAAVYFEYGTEPHTITANDGFLKFPWPDAPEEVKDRFRTQWEDPSHFLQEPEVLFKSIEHPGTPALRYLRDSRGKLDGGGDA